MKKHCKIQKTLLIPIVIALIVIILFRTVFLFGYVPSCSMEPTLKEGSFVIGLRLYEELKIGDIIVFRKEDVFLVKRIAATEGDIVEHGGMYTTVPENNFYVLGDNREHSYDSRYWEDPFVSAEDIIAKVILPTT